MRRARTARVRSPRVPERPPRGRYWYVVASLELVHTGKG